MSPNWQSAFLAGTNRCRCGHLHLARPLPGCQGGNLLRPGCQGGCVGFPECQGGLQSRGREAGAALNLLQQNSCVDAQQSSLLVAEQSTGSTSSALLLRNRGTGVFLDPRSPCGCRGRRPDTRTSPLTPVVVAPPPGGLVTMSRTIHYTLYSSSLYR
jgi:hypothetical protein